MAWKDLAEDTHQACLAVWGIPATWEPQGSPGSTVAIMGIIEVTPLEEPYTPPTSGASYDVANVQADVEGGAILTLKRNSGPAGCGVTNIRFWVDLDLLNPGPAIGDQILF